MVEMNEIWGYDNEIVKNHFFPNLYKSTLRDVSEVDYPRKNYFNPSIECLSLDAYVHSLRLSSTPKTMDAAIGIRNYSCNRTVSPRMLLVELRMDYESDRNLSVSELKRKDQNSRGYVNSTNVGIDSHPIFVFTKECIEEVRSWHKRQIQADGTISEWIFVSVPEFDDMIKDVNLMPVTYKNNVEDIKNKLRTCFYNDGIEALIEQISYWNGIAEQYQWKYDLLESEYLKNGLKEIWHEIVDGNLKSFSGDDYDYIEYAETEFPYIK